VAGPKDFPHNRVRISRSRSSKVVDFGTNQRAYATSYLSLTVTLVLTCTVSEIQRLISWKLWIFPTPLSFNALARVNPFEYLDELFRSPRLQSAKTSWSYRTSLFWHSASVWRTEGRRDNSITPCKNHWIRKCSNIRRNPSAALPPAGCGNANLAKSSSSRLWKRNPVHPYHTDALWQNAVGAMSCSGRNYKVKFYAARAYMCFAAASLPISKARSHSTIERALHQRLCGIPATSEHTCLEQSSATCLVGTVTDCFPESAEDSPLQSFFPLTHLTITL